MFWCFLSVEKGEAFPSGFDDSATPSKYLGQFEGSSQLELKSNSPSKRHCASGKLANNPCFGSGSSHLSGTDCGKGFSLQLLTRCSGQHSGNRAVQRCGVWFTAAWLTWTWQLMPEEQGPWGLSILLLLTLVLKHAFSSCAYRDTALKHKCCGHFLSNLLSLRERMKHQRVGTSCQCLVQGQ